MNQPLYSRRDFIRIGVGAAVAAPRGLTRTAETVPVPAAARAANAKVAICACREYGPSVRAALAKNFDLLGGVGGLVKNKTVTVKVNLTGTDFKPVFGRPVGEIYMTHPATVMALTGLLFKAGARRVRFVESSNSRQSFADVLTAAGWDVKALEALGKVEWEDTRNVGLGKDYATFRVPGGGHLFSKFDLNHSYHDTDVFVSLCKLKLHVTTGVTLTMKNLFGITPNALYGDEAPGENATKGRGRLHDLTGWRARENPLPFDPPGTTDRFLDSRDPGHRVPRIIADLCAARPVHLGIIDGITAMSGGEGPWTKRVMRVTTPGLIIVGFDPVATDTIGTAVMGYDKPRAPRGVAPFLSCDNHLLLAEQVGAGTADLARIEVVGMPLANARSNQYPVPL